jgi:threonine/homoserine/homoserine lactone efflux protein
MLPVDPARYAAYLVVMSAMCFFPGPANLFSLATGLSRGRKAMLKGVVGMNAANLTWYVLAALGLGAVTETAPGLFHLMRLGGALYLLWLAWPPRARRRTGRGGHAG